MFSGKAGRPPQISLIERWGSLYVNDRTGGRVYQFPVDGRLARRWRVDGKSNLDFECPAPHLIVYICKAANRKNVLLLPKHRDRKHYWRGKEQHQQRTHISHLVALHREWLSQVVR